MSRYRTIDLLDKRLVCRDEKFMSANEIVEELQDLEQRLAEAKAIYIELTNSEYIGRQDVIDGYFASHDLMDRFDELFKKEGGE